MIKIICDGCGREVKGASHLVPGIGPFGLQLYITVQPIESGTQMCENSRSKGEIINVCSPKCRLELQKRYPELGMANSPLQKEENKLKEN